MPEVACYQATTPTEGFTKILYAVRKPGEALWAAFALFRTEKTLLGTVDVPAHYSDPQEAVLEARIRLRDTFRKGPQPDMSLHLLKGGRS